LSSCSDVAEAGIEAGSGVGLDDKTLMSLCNSEILVSRDSKDCKDDLEAALEDVNNSLKAWMSELKFLSEFF
jgi:hypothetical protein